MGCDLDVDDDLNVDLDVGADVDATACLNSVVDANDNADLDLGLWTPTMTKRQAAAVPTDVVPSAVASAVASAVPSTPAAPTLTVGTLLQVLGLDLQGAFDALASKGLDLAALGINVTSILDTPIDLLPSTPVPASATAPVAAAAFATPLAARQNSSVDMGAILSALGISPQALEDALQAKGIDLAGLGIDLDSIYGVTSAAPAPSSSAAPAPSASAAPLTGDAATAMTALTSPTKRATVDLVALLKALGIDLSGLGIDLSDLSSVAIPASTA